MQGASITAHTFGSIDTGISSKGSLPYHPAFGRQVLFTSEPRPEPEDDELSTGQTISRMAQYVREDSRHPIIRRASYEATRGAAGDPRKEAAAIHTWVRGRVRFVQDAELAGAAGWPEDAEVLIRPVDLITMPDGQGDCDDFSMLAAAMLRAVGIPAAFKTIAADGADPDLYSHVYVVALLPGGPLVIDASHGPYAGWEARAVGKTRLWPIEEKRMRRLSGLGFDWDAAETIIGKGMDITGKILVPRFAVPQLAPGGYMQQGNNVYAQQQPGASSLAFPGVNVGGDATTILLIGAAALVMVAVLAGKRN